MRIGALIVTILVLAHHVIAYFHGAAHDQLQIPMAPWQNLFITGVILAVPLVSLSRGHLSQSNVFLSLWLDYQEL